MFYYSKADRIAISLTFAIIIILSILLHFLFRNKQGKIAKYKNLPLQILAVLVVLLEISKQIYYGLYVDFTYYVLPLHFCSLFVLLFPLSQLFGNKVGRIFKPCALIYSMLMTILLLANPHSILASAAENILGSFHNAHTYLFHFSVVAYLFFSLAINDYIPKTTDCINISLGVIIYTSYAIPFAFKLNTNYVNILQSSIEIFEKFRISQGQILYDTLLFLVAIIFVNILFFTYYGFYKLLSRKRV